MAGVSDNLIIWIIMGFIVMAGVMAIAAIHRKKDKTVRETTTLLSVDSGNKTIQSGFHKKESKELALKFEELPALTDTEQAGMVEIKDSQLIERIDGVIPGTLQVIANAAAIHGYNKAVRAAGNLYQVIIPKGEKLVNSKEIKGASRAIFRDAEKIKGQANLVPVDANMGKGLAAMNVANAAMGVAAMVVGQYYMTQINNKLEDISDGVKQIADFLNNEFKSRVYALVAEVQKYSTFRMEIMENKELLNRQLELLGKLEHECSQLLCQANLELQDVVKKPCSDYAEYEKAVSKAQVWYQYQQILLEVIGKIAELTYALNQGAVSTDFCHDLCTKYVNQSESTLKYLNDWHLKNEEKYKIDLQSGKRERQGFDGFIMNIPALFDSELHFKQIPGQMISMIAQQKQCKTKMEQESDSDLFREDVRLIAKEGKLYYLPPASLGTQIT